MYSNPVLDSMYPRDKDRCPRILTAGRARQRGDSNESSLTLSRDKRRGRVARNTTHSSVHSCPVSSFSGRPCILRPLLSFVRCSIHCVCNTALFSHPRRSHGPISPSVRFLFALSSSSLFYLIVVLLLPSLHHRPPPASFVLLFCRRARPAGISLLLHGTPLSSSCRDPCI